MKDGGRSQMQTSNSTMQMCQHLISYCDLPCYIKQKWTGCCCDGFMHHSTECPSQVSVCVHACTRKRQYCLLTTVHWWWRQRHPKCWT